MKGSYGISVELPDGRPLQVTPSRSSIIIAGKAVLHYNAFILLTVSHFRRNLAAMKFVGGEQAQAGCDFGF